MKYGAEASAAPRAAEFKRRRAHARDAAYDHQVGNAAVRRDHRAHDRRGGAARDVQLPQTPDAPPVVVVLAHEVVPRLAFRNDDAGFRVEVMSVQRGVQIANLALALSPLLLRGLEVGVHAGDVQPPTHGLELELLAVRARRRQRRARAQLGVLGDPRVILRRLEHRRELTDARGDPGRVRARGELTSAGAHLHREPGRDLRGDLRGEAPGAHGREPPEPAATGVSLGTPTTGTSARPRPR